MGQAGKNNEVSNVEMSFNAIAPFRKLERLVVYWQLSTHGKIIHNPEISIVPDDRMLIHCDFSVPPDQCEPMLWGLTSKVSVFPRNKPIDLLSISLFPGTFYSLFNLPAYRFAEKKIPLVCVIGPKARFLKKVFACGTIEERVSIFNSFFLEIAENRKPIYGEIRLLIDYLDSCQHMPSLGELSALTGWSKVWVGEMCKTWIGLPPHQLFANIRARNANRMLASGKEAALAACESGYVDQAHLINDFRRRGIKSAAIERNLLWRVPRNIEQDESHHIVFPNKYKGHSQ